MARFTTLSSTTLSLPLAALLLSSCTKQETTNAPTRVLVTGESGPLPAAGAANRLLKEQSAFLRKHANDVVDWYPWGPEAFALAKKENKPILVSIGYASCPWSQKLQEHAFKDPEIGRFQNRYFVNILVDREERPDINNAYLRYVFWKSRKSGWPLHVWLTPDGLPIYTGIYFPKHSEGPLPSWGLTLEHVSGDWLRDPEHVIRQAKISADDYILNYNRQWKGPDPEGKPDSPAMRTYTGKGAPSEYLAKLMSARVEELEQTILDLPTAKLKPLLEPLDEAAGARMLQRVSPLSAASLAAKGPDKLQASAYVRMVEGIRTLIDQKITAIYDPVNGGFTAPPRFLQPALIDMLARFSVSQSNLTDRRTQAMQMGLFTLSRALRGGIRDQLDGGFHRYANDTAWQLPQFEKMAYDQAFLAQAILSFHQLAPNAGLEPAVRGALHYLTSELNHPQGGFYSAEGSSSMAEKGDTDLTEGAYYLWSIKDISDAAGAEAMPLLTEVFGLEEYGNLPLDTPVRSRLPKMNLLSIQRTPEEAAVRLKMDPAMARETFEKARVALLAARSKRARPALDDKVLTGWTGLGVSALAQAGRLLQDEAFTARAIKGMEFILTRLRRPDGSLTHAYLDGPSSVAGFAEDYAGAVAGLIDLYETTGDVKWLKAAHELQEKELELLWDKEDGGFFDGVESPGLFHRVKSMDESTELAASTASTLNMQRLSGTLGLEDYRAKARQVVSRYSMLLASTPAAFLRLAKVADATLEQPLQIVISTSDAGSRKPFLTTLSRYFTPMASILYMDGGESEAYIKATNKQLEVPATGTAAAVHICRGGKLVKTMNSPAELEAWLKTSFSPPPAE